MGGAIAGSSHVTHDTQQHTLRSGQHHSRALSTGKSPDLTRVPAAPWVGSQNSLSPRLVFKKASIAAVCASFSATISLVAQRKQSVETRRAQRAPAACRFARSLASSFHMKRNFSEFLGSVETYRHSIQGRSPSTQSPSCIPFTRLHSVPHGSPGLVSRVSKHNCRAALMSISNFRFRPCLSHLELQPA